MPTVRFIHPIAIANQSTDKGSEYYPGDTYKITEHHTFTAQWEEEIPDDDGETDDGNSDDNGNDSENDNGSNNGNGSGSSVVKTGDEANLLGWLAMMLIATLGMTGCVVSRRRKRN